MANEVSGSVFDVAIEQFTTVYYNQVRGHVRQEVIRHRLESLLPDSGQGLDYGGGDARDTVWAARHGLRMDYWDTGTKAVKLARAEIGKAQLSAEVEVLDEDPALTDQVSYDLVLLHGVLQYVNRQAAQRMVSDIAKLTSSGGLISLATKNFEVVPKTNQLEDGVSVFNNGYDIESIAYSAEFLHDWLTSEGFSIVNIAGVRCVSENDHRNIHYVDPQELSSILEQERHLSSREESTKDGHMLHVLATKK